MRRVVGLKKDQLFLNGKAATSKTEIRSNLEAAGLSCSNPYYVVRQVPKFIGCYMARLQNFPQIIDFCWEIT